MVRTALVSALVCSLMLAAAPVHAQPARELFLRGQIAYQTGDYDTAVRLWAQAYELDPRPALQYNLAQACERLGRLAEAVQAYTLYIENTSGDDPRTQNARARVTSLRQRLGQTGIQITGGVEGAAIIIDGVDRGRLPHPDLLRVDPGSHRVVVRADGYQDFVSVVAVSAGQRAAVPVQLREGSSGQASATSGSGISTAGIIVAAAGGALLIGGAITGALALTTAGDAPGPIGGQADDARTLALVTDILLPVGAAAAIAGVVLMFALEDLGGTESAELVVPVLGPDYAGLAVRRAF